MHNEKCIENENNIKNQKLKNKMKIRKKIFQKHWSNWKRNHQRKHVKITKRSFEILRIKVTEKKKNHTGFMEHSKEIKYKLQNLKWGEKDK